jgi:hypothetical protein
MPCYKTRGFQQALRLQEVELVVDELEEGELEEDELEGVAAGAAAGVESAAGVELSVFAAGAFVSAGAASDAASPLFGA